jgi:hypothetical protein
MSNNKKEPQVIDLNEAPIKEKAARSKSLTEEQLPASLGGEQLNEWELSWVGKLFFAGVAGYLGSKAISAVTSSGPSVPKLPIKIKGTPEQIQAITAAITSSKAFQDEISKPGAKIDDVIKKLNLKNLNKQNFEKIVKRPWPL